MCVNSPVQLALMRENRHSRSRCRKATLVVGFPDASQAFLASRPEWTLKDALLTTPDGQAARVVQKPFIWIAGAWETELSIMPVEPPPGMRTVVFKARVAPETLRRWHDVGINPFIEACAQVQDHWRRAKPGGVETLTWL